MLGCLSGVVCKCCSQAAVLLVHSGQQQERNRRGVSKAVDHSKWEVEGYYTRAL